MIPIDQPRAALHMVSLIMARQSGFVAQQREAGMQAAGAALVPGAAMPAAGAWRLAASLGARAAAVLHWVAETE